MTKPDLAKRPADVSSMFDRVASKYDLTNDVLSGGIAPSWRVRTRKAIDPKPGMRILDVACGTGTMSRILAESGAEVVGIDFSQGMIAEGIRRHGNEPNITFQQGDATNLPFEDASFDAVTVSFGIRNFQDPKRALREMLRVLKPGGKLVVCEFSTPTTALMRGAYDFYLDHAMPIVTKLVSSDPEAYDYLQRSIQAWPAQREFANWLRQAGFTDVAYRNLTGGIVALHRGTRPAN